MSATIEGRSEQLLKAKNFGFVATHRADGTIHDVPVWVDVQDGRPTLNTAEGRSWPRNLERDPRLTLTVPNMDNPYEYVEIRGRVAERTHEEPTSTSTRWRRSTSVRIAIRTAGPGNGA